MRESAVLADEMAVSLEKSLARSLPMRELLGAAESDVPLGNGHRRALVELGLFELAVPERNGGLGLDAGGLARVWFVAGRRLLPAPFREEALVLAPLLAGAASFDEVARQRLEALRAGSLCGGGRVLLDDDDDLHACALWASPGAEMVHVLTPERALLFEIGASVARSDAIDPGQGLSEVDLVALHPRYTFGRDVARPLWVCWQIAVLAEAAGCADRVLEISVEYAKNRQQFGRAIAQFQSVANLLADMRVRVDASKAVLARLLVLSGDDAEALLRVARFAVPQAARAVCEGAIQVHGGIGFTWEYGLHLFYRRVLQIQAALGGAQGAAADIGRQYLAAVGGRHG